VLGELVAAQTQATVDVDDTFYTKQFFTITREGHTRPAPEFGAPCLVWHVAFWPKQDLDPQNTDATTAASVGPGPEAFRKFEIALRKEYASRRQRLIEDFNALLRGLQTRGRPWRKVDEALEPNIEQFVLKAPADWHEEPKEWRDPTFDGAPLPVFATESIGFTLWWHAAGDKPLSERSDKRPRPTDLRIRVQADVHPDYSTIGFYMDVGKVWRQTPIYSDSIQAPDQWNTSTDRRAKVLSAAAHIKRICETRTNSALVSASITPEPDRMPAFQQDAASLKAYADYLYEGIWAEFCEAFGVSLQRIAGKTDKVFANFRGIVLSTRGTGESLDSASTAATGGEPFKRFDVVEANSVLKGFWPFFRRIRPEADYRDWIACGVFDWRALYVSSLGSQSEFDDLDEGDVTFDVPAGELPERRVRGPDWDNERYKEAPTTPQKDRPAPFRYLFLTKYEPNRKQIGRLVERINAMGTMRLYALKNWSIIRDADAQIRIYGQELDSSMKAWTERVLDIEEKFEARQEKVLREISEALERYLVANEQGMPAAQIAKARAAAARLKPREAPIALRELADIPDEVLTKSLDAVPQEERDWALDFKRFVYTLDKSWRDLNADWDRELAEENQLAESRLIAIGVGLDRLGKGAIGGIHYRINRARFYSDVFRTLAETLRVGLVETWTSYTQFLTRGLNPAFKFLDSVGARLGSLRERLHGEMQSIQTSAIVNQTEATRDNTVQLENVLREVRQLFLLGEHVFIRTQDTIAWWRKATAIVAILGTLIGLAGKWLIEYWWRIGWWPFSTG
jgi:hypothetical protein